MTVRIGAFNVEATVNDYFMTAVSSWTYPPLFATRPNVRTDWTLIPQLVPCFSLVYIPVELRDMFQGRHVGPTATELGGRQKTILEISSWVTSVNAGYMAQLRMMRDFIYETFAASPTLTVRDFITNPALPTSLVAKVNCDLPNEIAVLRDENPVLYRSRSLIVLTYTARAA